ncbi:MAG: hypothetical protein CMJ39_12410 [Phycisphaerae bacterium]|nr:hypothetical protein [Phycisphaerae bacterium]
MAEDKPNQGEDQPIEPDDIQTVQDSSVLLRSTTQDPMIGLTIGQYTIKDIIGAGGMGTVYRASQKSPRRTVAIKVMKEGLSSPKALRRFEFESQLLARLRHPGIAQVYEAGTHDLGSTGLPYFVMEYIPNAKSLTRYAVDRNLGTRERLELFSKVCNAVHHGHQKGIVHRDLKPGNILVGSSGEPRIIDFGVARSTDSDMVMTTLQTDVGALVGTLQYMSPEQVEADPNDIDTRSDVYALGVIFFELLTHTLPYDVRQAAVHEAARVVKEEEPTRISTIDRQLRGDVETIALKALEKDRRRRYQSAVELEQDIARYLSGDPIEARPASMVYRLGKLSRKYRSATIGFICTILAIIAGGVIATIGWQEAEHQKQLVTAERDRVEERNAVLDQTVSRLLSGVMKQVRYLGNSASAQRALLDLARDHIDQLVSMDQDSPLRQAQVAGAWLRAGKSYLNTSGIGYGNLEDAEAALMQAGTSLDAIDLAAIEDDSLRQGVEAMKLDHPKLMAELERGKAAEAASTSDRSRSYQRAAEFYATRREAGKAYGDQGGNGIKALDVQYSSSMGLGNVLLETGRMDEARSTYEEAVRLAQKLVELDTSNRERRLRDKAICLHGLASVTWEPAPQDALRNINEAIQLAEAIMALSPDNTRRPRDLAMMLALRGRIHLVKINEFDRGMQDYQRSIELFTIRAIESPMEPKSQSDFHDTAIQFQADLAEIGRKQEGNDIINEAVTRLQCVAEAESLAGRPEWDDILLQVESTLE